MSRLRLLPLLLLDGLLPEGHVLHVLLQSVERRVGLHAYSVVVVLGVSPARREANDNAPRPRREAKRRRRSPGPQASCAESHENGADEFSERCSIDGIQFLLLAVAQIVIVESGPREAHALCRLVVVQQPLELRGEGTFLVPRTSVSQTKKKKKVTRRGKRHRVTPLQEPVLQQPAKAGGRLTVKTADKSSERRLPLQCGRRGPGRSQAGAGASVGESNLHGC